MLPLAEDVVFDSTETTDRKEVTVTDLEKALYQLRILGFNTELVVVPYSESHLPGTVI